MLFFSGAGASGATRHFRTTAYPENIPGILINPLNKKVRSRAISTLLGESEPKIEEAAFLPVSSQDEPKPKANPFAVKIEEDGIENHVESNFDFNQFSIIDSSLESIVGKQDPFERRNLGVEKYSENYQMMLNAVGCESMEQLIERTVPENIRISIENYQKMENICGKKGISELAMKNLLDHVGNMNIDADKRKNYLGQGWNPAQTPSIISNMILRNPAWNTAYTPYQAEISQGRLEALFNFQTMIVELTGLPLANASLLDEATACAEAMSLTFAVGKNKKKVFLIDDKCHPQNIRVMKTRAALRNFETRVMSRKQMLENFNNDVAGCIVQYPDTDGKIHDYEDLVKIAHENKSLVTAACDPLALTLLKTPGEFNCDIAVGTTQRFGIPLWLGGPHAGFFATKDKYKRHIPGRIIGRSIDSNGQPAFRLALQTREQHIKREKATSNVCTAQALLANGSAFYGIYYGPNGLKDRAYTLATMTKTLAIAIKSAGHQIEYDLNRVFDTLKIKVAGDRSHIFQKAEDKKINLRRFNDGVSIGITLNDTTSYNDLMDLFYCFGCEFTPMEIFKKYRSEIEIEGGQNNKENLYDHLSRQNKNFMQQDVFQKYQTEQEFARYCRNLELKDLSLVDSMIPLGSCTMKLNPSVTLDAMNNSKLANIHPLQSMDQIQGWIAILADLERMLSETCGFDAFFLQPNSGAQGELAGLATIRNYHEANGEGLDKRKYILIPTSAHGTNPASAALCGYKIKPIKVLAGGSISIEDLDKNIKKLGTQIAGMMITYPSTYGVFDNSIRTICDKVHEVGGQIYLDGANMNAQLGLCRPGDYGADVSHLNLHKTFSGPHGGGGPGAGPIGVKSHLAAHLPDSPFHPDKLRKSLNQNGALAGTDYGSPLVLAISWAWMKLLGAEGMKHSSEMAILNANYMRTKLENDYEVLFKGENGYCAHEFIIDIRPFKKIGVEALDVCKRLQDFGLHAGTMSWPIANTLMFEPTESESKEEIDKYITALKIIRNEIRQIENNENGYTFENNPIKNAPHTLKVYGQETWDKPYSREVAGFPAEFVKNKKHWPTKGRVDDTYGDTNLVCSCDGMENYQ